MSNLDGWLDKHPRVDRLVTEAYRARLIARQAVPHWRETRRWKPGMFYLDHGSTPCVLHRLYDSDTLEGVSLVDGRLIGGCSIYACGPEPVTRKEALELARKLRGEDGLEGERSGSV